MVRARLRQRMKAARISSSSAKLDTAKLKTAVILGAWRCQTVALHLLDSFQEKEMRRTIGTMQASSASKLLVVALAADRQVTF